MSNLSRRGFFCSTASMAFASASVHSLLLTVPGNAQEKKEPKPNDSIPFFNHEKLRKFTITVDEENLKILKRDPRKYVRAQVTDGGRTAKDVGLHLKGAAGSFRGFEDRPALTLNFDKFEKKQTYRDLTKIHLNNSVQDETCMWEIICGEIATAIKLPVARATHAVLELNGKNRGQYVVKEGFDKLFLKNHFPTTYGNFYEGPFLGDIDRELKNANDDEGEPQADLKALVAICREKNADKRWGSLQEKLDIDKVLRFIMFESLTAHWDGYCNNINNYRIYHEPKSDKLTFIPHGMDQMFSNPGYDLGIATKGMVAKAIHDCPEGKKLYWETFDQVILPMFKADVWIARVDAIMKNLKPFLEQQLGKEAANRQEKRMDEVRGKLRDRAKHIEKVRLKKKK